jgi:hypothetical protein
MYLIPKLIGKNALSKIINVDFEFYNKRRRQLNFFLNFLFNHNFLKTTKEFIKFINDPEFDEEYFKKEDLLYNFPESKKCQVALTTKLYGMFSSITNYFSKEEEFVYKPTEQELRIKNIENYYTTLLGNIKETKKFIVRLLNNFSLNSLYA